MKISGIYKIQSKCKPERVYIGSASDICQRWRAHMSLLRKNKHHSDKLQRHYNKYGKEDLLFSVLVCCDGQNLLDNEQFFIDSYNPYFNNCPLAKSRKGSKSTEETKKKISEALKGNLYSLGCKHTDEFCKKSSDNRKKNWQNPEYRRKVTEALRESYKRRGPNNPSLKALHDNRYKNQTPEARAKQKASFKKTINDPNSKAYKIMHSEEIKKRFKRNMGNHSRWHTGPLEDCPICKNKCA